MQWDPAVQPPRAAPAPSLASPQPAPQMDELMMRRYGLIPAERSGEGANDPAMDPNFDWSTYDPSAPVSAAPPKAAPGLQMDELMMRRYGLIPPASYQIGHSQPVMDAYGRWRMPPPSYADESYSHPAENPFQLALQNPLSTFGLEVDTASYAIVRRFINENRRPPVDAVRVEEMINYFTYDYPGPAGDDPLAVHLEVAGCPWNSAHRLVRVGLKAREIAHATRPACNLVFLIDVSGSMSPENKLPLLRQGLLMLTDRLRGDDSVGIVTYAGGAGVALPPTSGGQRQRIRDTLTALQAGGSTHGSAGIRRAYELARQNFREDGVNRVILCTDGDFNVGVTSQSDLTRLIENEAKSGIFLTVLGFGVGNYKDTTMEALADRGNGQYAYIDNLNEAHKVLVNEITSTL
ncbi:MAG: von Willebrand factor type A domain-containing protein, partial [Verrucomicrobiae bacterium]|nr:von Willebrand factor type A domain-containing protein [Verrucomicrobiae bacterium]